MRKILEAFGFEHTGNKGDHRIYEKGNRHVEIDWGEKDFGTVGMQIIIGNAGISRKKFYCATKVTARKINKKYDKP